MTRVKLDISPDQADAEATADHGNSGWSPLDCLRSLGRAASIAAGAPNDSQNEFHGIRIAIAGQDGVYCARITHHHGKAVRLPAPLRNQLDAARFPSAEEAVQHARFLIASGALNSFLDR
jgi:hypothetical protein